MKFLMVGLFLVISTMRPLLAQTGVEMPRAVIKVLESKQKKIVKCGPVRSYDSCIPLSIAISLKSAGRWPAVEAYSAPSGVVHELHNQSENNVFQQIAKAKSYVTKNLLDHTNTWNKLEALIGQLNLLPKYHKEKSALLIRLMAIYEGEDKLKSAHLKLVLDAEKKLDQLDSVEAAVLSAMAIQGSVLVVDVVGGGEVNAIHISCQNGELQIEVYGLEMEGEDLAEVSETLLLGLVDRAELHFVSLQKELLAIAHINFEEVQVLALTGYPGVVAAAGSGEGSGPDFFKPGIKPGRRLDIRQGYAPPREETVWDRYSPERMKERAVFLGLIAAFVLPFYLVANGFPWNLYDLAADWYSRPDGADKGIRKKSQ